MSQKPIIFFDGVCHLCNGFVDFVILRDSQTLFQFAPLQGETAQKFLTSEERTRLETVILLENNQKYSQSEAVLRILTRLGGLFKIFNLAYLLPKFVRNKAYSWVAKNRYAWFGEREFCRLPQPHERERLLP